MTNEILTPTFAGKLKTMGYNVSEIISELSLPSNSGDPKRLLRQWTGLPNDVIENGLFNRERDVIAPKIYAVLTQEVSQWIKTNTTQGMPELTVKQVSRFTELSPQKIISILEKFPFVFSIDEYEYRSFVQKPTFPDERLTLKDSSSYGLSPTRIAQDAKYNSKKPGSRQIQKSGLQASRINAVIRNQSWEEAKIRFIDVDSNQSAVEFGVMSELEITLPPEQQSALDIIYAQENAQDILAVYTWFQTVGFGKNWIYKQKEAFFAENLIRLSRGEPVDFLIWNCIGFEWFADPKGNMPTCCITNNLDAAITPFFATTIYDMYTALSTLGSPNITILVPSNEGLDTNGVWRYEQSENERRRILSETVMGLRSAFNSTDEFAPQVMLWEDYLASRNARYETSYYTQEGQYRLRNSPKFNKIIQEAVKSGRSYFAQNGITNIKTDMLTEREILYYSVYAGEGVAFEELQNNGNNIVVVNFEEFRVPQMEFIGADGNLSIVTPISESQMQSYYGWEARQIVKRTK